MKARTFLFPVGVLAVVLVAAAVIDGALGWLPVSIPFTPDHFKAPMLPPSPANVWNGVTEYFGGVAALCAFVIVPCYLVMAAVVWVRFRQPFTAAPGEAAAQGDHPGNLRRLFAVLLAVVLAGGMLRLAATEPVVAPDGPVTRLSLAARFPFTFNAALAAKAGFNETVYRERMFTAFLGDRQAFFDFAASSYWATYAGEDGRSRLTTRFVYACQRLAKLAEAKTLAEGAGAEGVRFCRERQQDGAAATMAKELYAAYPDNKTIAENYRYYAIRMRWKR